MKINQCLSTITEMGVPTSQSKIIALDKLTTHLILNFSTHT